LAQRGVDAQNLHHLRRPLAFHFHPEYLKRVCISAMHDARTRPRGWRIGAFGWRRYQRLDQLVSEADDLVGAHVAADHPLGKARLKRLIDDAS
jgi:hypothetical protein